MNCKSMTASIWCNDHCGMLVFDRTIWAKDDELLEFSLMDSYIGRRKYHGLFAPGVARAGVEALILCRDRGYREGSGEKIPGGVSRHSGRRRGREAE